MVRRLRTSAPGIGRPFASTTAPDNVVKMLPCAYAGAPIGGDQQLGISHVELERQRDQEPEQDVGRKLVPQDLEHVDQRAQDRGRHRGRHEVPAHNTRHLASQSAEDRTSSHSG